MMAPIADAMALNSQGNALFEQGRVLEAGKYYREALRLQPNHADAHVNLGRVCMSLQRWEEAITCLRTGLTHDSNNALAHVALGDIYYYRLGQHTAALPCYQQALALRPDDVKIRMLVEALGGAPGLARVPADYLANLYDPHAERFDQGVQRRGDRSPLLLQSVLEPAPTTPGLNVLDLGCGTGLCGMLFRAWASNLIGVDVSSNMLAKARERGTYDELVLGDLLTAVQDRENEFDLVLASDVLIFFGDLMPLFQAVQRALRPGGRFAFTVDLLEEVGDYRMTPWVHFAHARSYLQKLALETHLQEVCVQQQPFPRENGQQVPGLVVVLSRGHAV